MARAPNEKVNKAFELYKSGMKLVEVASQLGIPEGTIRSWKNRYKWDGKNATLQMDKRNVAKDVKQVIDNTELNDQQRMFCLYYTKYFNASKAYRKVYDCDEYSARVNSSRLMAKEYIKAEINRLKQGKMNRAMFDMSDLFQMYLDIASANMTDYVEFGREKVPVMGPFGPIVIKDEETGDKIELKKEINVVKFKESTEIDGALISEIKQGKDGASIKLQDKMKAMKWLDDHIGLATEEQKAKIAVLKAKVNSDEEETTEDDGFIDALKGKVDGLWQEE